MNELIKVNTNEEKITLSARELYEFLKVQSNFTTWFHRMCEYGFTENTDFIPILEESIGGRPSQDYQITIEMGKEIAMLQRSEKGKQVRQYFIELEKQWNSPEKVMARALEIAHKTINDLTIENQEMKPKALFADSVKSSNTSILVGDLAKLLKQNGCNMGANRLFEWLRENDYLIKRQGSDRNMPTQRSMEQGLFEIKERTIMNSDGSVRITKTPKVTGKGQIYFVNKFLQLKD